MTQYTLTQDQREAARARAVDAARLCLNHEPDVHYSQDMTLRWTGINKHLDASKGQWPNYADCSGLVTWAIWNAVYLAYGMEDIVNGSDWKSGYTGTMLSYGTVIGKASDALPGDAVIYGNGGTGQHTALISDRGSVPMVISHGSEAGPYHVPYNYRTDIMSIRRYIDDKPHECAVSPDPPPTPEDALSLQAVVKSNGAIALFVYKEDGTVMHAYQTGPNQGWAGAEPGKNAKWYGLGKPGK